MQFEQFGFLHYLLQLKQTWWPQQWNCSNPAKQKEMKISDGQRKGNYVSYWINGGHGIVDEVILLLLWGDCVAKANIAVLLIPTVATSTEQEFKQSNTFIKKNKKKFNNHWEDDQVITSDKSWRHHSTSLQMLYHQMWQSLLLIPRNCGVHSQR